jgi:hypothetical protein
MQGREQLTLDQAIRRAASAGTLVRHEAVAAFLEVLRLAAESQAIPDAAATLLEEDGTLTFVTAPGTDVSDPAEPIWAACRLATRLFGAAKLEPPLALAGASEAVPERFPTLRHLRDAFELELLLSGTPPPTDVERRMAIAALTAKARQPRGTSARSWPRRSEPPTDPPPAALDSSTWDTEPPEPAAPAPARWLALLAGARPGSRRWLALFAGARLAPPGWLALVAVATLGIGVGVLLGRGTSPRPPAAPGPSPAALVPEIALPPPDVRPPAVADSRGPARERVAPAAVAQPVEAAPRPVRKLRRSAAAGAVPDAGSAPPTKLQLGDESLKEGRFFEALIAFREALDQDPPVPAAARRLGDAYRAHHDTDLAVAAYERYLELEPTAPDADEVRAAVEQLRSSTPLAR